MRLPRVQFAVKTMMIAVAITAASLGVLERRGRFRRLSLAHKTESFTLQVSDLELYLLLTPASGEETEDFEERLRTASPVAYFMLHHLRLSRKYEHASSQPWFPVASDPPSPRKPSKQYVKAMLATIDRVPYMPPKPRLYFPEQPQRPVIDSKSLRELSQLLLDSDG